MNPRVVFCQACRKPFVFLYTTAGKRMPVDASEYVLEAAKAGAKFDPKDEGMTSHFVTCPERDRFRRPREKKGRRSKR